MRVTEIVDYNHVAAHLVRSARPLRTAQEGLLAAVARIEGAPSPESPRSPALQVGEDVKHGTRSSPQRLLEQWEDKPDTEGGRS